MANVDPYQWGGGSREWLASGVRTANGDSAVPINLARMDRLRVQLNVTAVAGSSPTLNVVIEDTLDNGATWNQILAFTQAAGVTRQVLNHEGIFSDRARIRWTLGGTTPSFTFAVHGYAE